jgi:hypothetical protein
LDRLFDFPSERKHAEDFYIRKIRRLPPGLNPRTREPEASILISRPPKPLTVVVVNKFSIKIRWMGSKYLFLRNVFRVLRVAMEDLHDWFRDELRFSGRARHAVLPAEIMSKWRILLAEPVLHG